MNFQTIPRIFKPISLAGLSHYRCISLGPMGADGRDLQCQQWLVVGRVCSSSGTARDHFPTARKHQLVLSHEQPKFGEFHDLCEWGNAPGQLVLSVGAGLAEYLFGLVGIL